MPKEELLLVFSSPKWPERFSRSVAVRAKPESLLEIGVVGMGGKFVETGDTDDCGLVLLDLLVVGRSDLLLSSRELVNALNTGVYTCVGGSGSPKLDEFCDTHFPRVLFGASEVKRLPFSLEKASYGKDSMA
jgi:hypothetical protein